MTDLEEILKRDEDLHPDLLRWMEGNSLRHPLVISPAHGRRFNAWANWSHEEKLKQLQTATEKADWRSFIWIHERPYRLDPGFLRIEDKLSDVEYWRLLGAIWQDSENIWQHKRLWTRLFASNRPDRLEIMNAEEKNAFANQPETIRVFRGHAYRNRQGLSWTLSEPVAHWFAGRWTGRYARGKPRVVAGIAPKNMVIAFFNGRGEHEIVIDARYVQNQRDITWDRDVSEQLEAQRKQEMMELIASARPPTPLPS